MNSFASPYYNDAEIEKRTIVRALTNLYLRAMNMTTSETLLQRVHRLDDQAAWDQFYHLYAPWIKGCAIRSGCKPSMADDVVQETMASIIKYLHKFHYEPQQGRFRGLLKTILRRRVADAFAAQKKLKLATSDTRHEQLEDYQDFNVVVPCQSWDDLWESNLVREAYEQVKENIRDHGDPLTIEIFEMFVLQKCDARDVRNRIAKKYKLEIKENKIYQDKKRVIDMWKLELKKLRDEVGE